MKHCKSRCVKRTRRWYNKIISLPNIYLVGCWARHGVMAFHYAGYTTPDGVPYVWNYYDGNGTCDEYHCVPLTYVTTGIIYGWTTSENAAKKMANALRQMEEENRNGK